MTVLLLDNYDSFTWNLAQYLEELGARVDVVHNDATTPDAVAAQRYGQGKVVAVLTGPKLMSGDTRNSPCSAA